MATMAEVLKKYRWELMAKENVVAVGYGPNMVGGVEIGQAIVCSVVKKIKPHLLSESQLIPRSLDDISTDVIETGVYRIPFPEELDDSDRTSKRRPSPCGVSAGHFKISAGTNGCLVEKDNEIYMMSNNHVYGDSNAGEIGDPILQPGSYDGGSNPDDIIAHLSEFVPIIFEGGIPPTPCPIGRATAALANIVPTILRRQTRLRAIQETTNLVDAAIAKPVQLDDVVPNILEVGRIMGISEATLRKTVKKSGRTTGLTHGSIIQTNVTVRVNYGDDRVAVFEDQVMAGAMSQGGDSGSVVLDSYHNIVGLLFAGSDSTTVINRIQNVFSLLGVTYL